VIPATLAPSFSNTISIRRYHCLEQDNCPGELTVAGRLEMIHLPLRRFQVGADQTQIAVGGVQNHAHDGEMDSWLAANSRNGIFTFGFDS